MGAAVTGSMPTLMGIEMGSGLGSGVALTVTVSGGMVGSIPPRMKPTQLLRPFRANILAW